MVRLIVARALATAALALLSSSCIAFVFSHTRTHRPLDEARTQELVPGATTFGEALARCGAPTDAWELPGGARAIAYGWIDTHGDNVSIQLPLQGDYSPNLVMEQSRRDLYGVVLFFDEHDVLTDVRRGYLRTLKNETAPSAELDDDAVQ